METRFDRKDEGAHGAIQQERNLGKLQLNQHSVTCLEVLNKTDALGLVAKWKRQQKYRENLQQGHVAKGTVLCAVKCAALH